MDYLDLDILTSPEPERILIQADMKRSIHNKIKWRGLNPLIETEE